MKCFHCKLRIYHFRENEDPLIVHAQRKANCGFLLATKGFKWVQKARGQVSELSSGSDEEAGTATGSEVGTASNTATGDQLVAQNSNETAATPTSDSQSSDDKFLCSLCCSSKISIAIQNCGHVLCEKCFVKESIVLVK